MSSLNSASASSLISIVVILLLANFALGGLDGHCPPLGPVLPAPTNPSISASVQNAIIEFTEYFSEITSGLSGSAISISIASIHEDGKLIDLHHTPQVRQTGSTTNVTGDTVYRIGSISKVFTVLAILMEGVHMDDPIANYLNILVLDDDQEFAVDWIDVTVGSLASHMSGIGLDLMNDLGDVPDIPWQSQGFPLLCANSTPGCRGVYGLPACTESEFYRDFNKHRPVYKLFATPMYSNLGFDVLGLALEWLGNRSYTDYMQNSMITYLELNRTSLGPPDLLETAFVPNQTVEESRWGVDLGWDNPAGGFYSSSNDLVKLGSSILDGSLLGDGATRKWLKPVSSTSTLGRGMGAPWEILRSTNLTSDGRLIELYTKGGDIGSYHSKLCLVPDYDLVISIMTAGPEAAFQLSFSILSRLLTTVLPAIEQAGKDEVATAGMVGTFSDAASNSTITLSLDDGPGLAISDWVVRGQDANALYASDGVAGVGFSTLVRPRLYPTSFQSGNQTAWRAVFDLGAAEDAAQNDAQFAWAGQSCQTWANMDRFSYGFNGIDDFVFTWGQGKVGAGSVSSLTNHGFQVQMVKT